MTDEWIKKIWYTQWNIIIYTVEYYSVIKRWINLDDFMLCETNQSQNDKYCICEIFRMVNLIETRVQKRQ